MPTTKRKEAAQTVKTKKRLTKGRVAPNGKLRDILTIAEQSGLLDGPRTEIIRGRMPRALVDRAKSSTGVRSDTKLMEVALANLAVSDDYADWLLSRQGRIDKDIDLEI